MIKLKCMKRIRQTKYIGKIKSTTGLRFDLLCFKQINKFFMAMNEECTPYIHLTMVAAIALKFGK